MLVVLRKDRKGNRSTGTEHRASGGWVERRQKGLLPIETSPTCASAWECHEEQRRAEMSGRPGDSHVTTMLALSFYEETVV